MIVGEVVPQDQVNQGCLPNFIVLQAALTVCLEQCLSNVNQVACPFIDPGQQEQQKTVQAVQRSLIGFANSANLCLDDIQSFSIVFLSIQQECVEGSQICFDFR